MAETSFDAVAGSLNSKIVTKRAVTISFSNGVGSISDSNAKTTSTILVGRNQGEVNAVFLSGTCTSDGTVTVGAWDASNRAPLTMSLSNINILIVN